MEMILAYFETISAAHRSIILVGGLTLFWALEGGIPLMRFDYKKWNHALPNLFFTGTTIIINFILAFLLLNTSDWTVINQFGILNWIPSLPLWLEILIGVMLLDLIGAYLAHWAEHKIKPLWMIHLVHHHYRLPYPDSNFGNIFSIWDHIFGTFLPFDRKRLIYGVDVFYDEEANGKLSTLLKQPFQPYSKPTLSDENKS